MTKNLLALLLGVALLGGLLASGAFVIARSSSTPEDRAFAAAFRQVEVGMSERRVIALLGEPDQRSSRFRLAQERGFEDAYLRAANSGSVRYLVWQRHLDFVYTIGLTSSGEVAIAEMGGT